MISWELTIQHSFSWGWYGKWFKKWRRQGPQNCNTAIRKFLRGITKKYEGLAIQRRNHAKKQGVMSTAEREALDKLKKGEEGEIEGNRLLSSFPIYTLAI